MRQTTSASEAIEVMCINQYLFKYQQAVKQFGEGEHTEKIVVGFQYTNMFTCTYINNVFLLIIIIIIIIDKNISK